MVDLYKKVHPDLTRHLKGGRCNHNSKTNGERNAYIDKHNNDGQAMAQTDAKTLGFHKTKDSTLELTLPQINTHVDVNQVVNNIKVQVQSQNREHVSLDGPSWSDDDAHTIPSRKTQRHSKKDIMDGLFREALDYVVGGSDPNHDTKEMKACSKLYRLGIDPRLIFFDKTLTQYQRDHAIETLASVAGDVEVPRVLIVFTSSMQQDPRRRSHMLKVPYDFDAQTLQDLIKGI